MISNRVCTALVAVGLAAAAVLAGAREAAAQAAAAQAAAAPRGGGRPKGSQAIEIRGQVPTPQVVTVRPRQVPTFSRDVLTPAFFDRQFWASLLTPYMIAPDLSTTVDGAPTTVPLPPLPADSGHRPPPTDSSGRVISSASPPSLTPGLTSRVIASDGTQNSTSNAPREK